MEIFEYYYIYVLGGKERKKNRMNDVFSLAATHPN